MNCYGFFIFSKVNKNGTYVNKFIEKDFRSLSLI